MAVWNEDEGIFHEVMRKSFPPWHVPNVDDGGESDLVGIRSDECIFSHDPVTNGGGGGTVIGTVLSRTFPPPLPNPVQRP